MLSLFDDYPIHQTPETIRQPVTSDPNAYDRYWFNGMDANGEVYFAVALGRYPNRFVQDGAFTVVLDGRQRSFFGSRLAPDDPADMTIGPYSVEVVEPMRTLRVRLESNESGIECDLTYRARSSALEEERMTYRRDGMVAIDLTRFAQFGRWDGWIEVDGQRVELNSSTTYGTRDRSWGVRPLGEDAGGRPGTASALFWNWLPLQFENHVVHAWRYESPDGTTLQSEAMIAPTYADGSTAPINAEHLTHFNTWKHDFTFDSGTRAINGGSIQLLGPGDPIEIHIVERLATAFSLGVGYGHDEWGHGMWHGELEFGRDGWAIEDVDLSDRRFMLMHHVVRLQMGDQMGLGIVEQSYTGPYAPYGFVGETGVAP